MSVEEVRARLAQLGWDVPLDGSNEANHRALDVADAMTVVVATTMTVLSDWHTATGSILPLLADRLDNDVADVRYHAAALLACLGPAATPHADQLATLVTDQARRESRAPTTVGDAALWTLARLDDPRRSRPVARHR